MSYQSTRNTRRESRTLVHRIRGGKLYPAMATGVRPNEGGMIAQAFNFELDPIAGRMITPIRARVTSVFNPVQAIDALKNPDADFAGLTEVLREKLLSNNPLFGLENETEISQRCGVNPRSISGVKKVNEMVRGAVNASVNFLRLRKYHKASLLLWNNTAITPSVISQTVLERMNGVLDPDDRINGMVQLDLPDVQLPVSGIGYKGSATATAAISNVREANGETVDYPSGHTPFPAATAVRVTGTGADARPDIFAEFNGVVAGGVSLTDFYNAETMDRLTRKMAEIVEANPQYGEEMVLRWAHGLSVDTGKTPFILAEREVIFGRDIVGATDTSGVEAKTLRSDMMTQVSIQVPVPKTELGGIVVTFVEVLPDETISSQPHPILSEPWGLDNFVADELALDPVPVTIRDLDADCTAAQESTVALYVGHNQLKATYVSYGLARNLDPETVENKTAIWQLDLPLSVTPDTILYPEELDHYPFAYHAGDVCTVTATHSMILQTPMIIGPTPVEALSIIDDADLFGDDE